MAPRDPCPTARRRVVALAVLLLGPSLVGCLSDPSTQIQARRGDLAELELVVADDGAIVLPAEAEGTSVADLCPAPIHEIGGRGCPATNADYVLLNDRPARLPDGFGNATPLPAPLVDVVAGLGEGEHRSAEDVQAWGPHRESLVREHDRRERLPRIVDDETAYGRTWNGTRLANGSFEIQPEPADEGARLEVSNWCNERFCLFVSRLVNWTDSHLVVEHLAEEGDRVHVRSLATFLTVAEANRTGFTVDGNDPRAGGSYDVYVRVVDLRAAPQGERRAPSFDLPTFDGDRVALADLLGQPVVLEFFATWCPSCRENADHLADVRDRFGDRVAIVSVDVDPWESSKALASFVEEHDVTWPVALDEEGEVSKAYGVGTLSTEVIVGPQGTIRHVETGVADHERVVAVLDDLVNESAPREEAQP